MPWNHRFFFPLKLFFGMALCSFKAFLFSPPPKKIKGLFRVAGSQSETTDLKDKIDKGQPVDFGSGRLFSHLHDFFVILSH